MSISKTGVVIVDSSCLKYFENAEVLDRVRNNLQTVDMQIRLSAINILEVMKTQNTSTRDRLLNIIRNVNEGRPFLPWPLDLIKCSGDAHARGEKGFWSGESGLEQEVYGNSIKPERVMSAQQLMNSLESDFTDMHQNARRKLKSLLNEHRATDHYNTSSVFLDEVWTTEYHLSEYINGIWKVMKLPGEAPIQAILEDEIWRIFLEINGFAAFERAVQKEQPKRVHYPDLLQLIYVSNASKRIVISSDCGFLRAAHAILRNRYPNVRVEECSEFMTP